MLTYPFYRKEGDHSKGEPIFSYNHNILRWKRGKNWGAAVVMLLYLPDWLLCLGGTKASFPSIGHCSFRLDLLWILHNQRKERILFPSIPHIYYHFLWNRILKRAIQIYIFPKDQENRPYLVMRVNHFLVLSVSWDGPVWNSSATQIQHYFTLNPWYTTFTMCTVLKNNLLTNINF